MERNHIHALPHNKKWAVKSENKSNPISLHDTQESAIAAGKPIAQADRNKLVIHRPNGEISVDGE